MYDSQFFILLSATVFCLLGILFVVMVNVVGFSEYLSSKNATSKDNSINLDKDVRRRYSLIIPFANSRMGILRKENGKYWLASKNNAGIKVWYILNMTLFLAVFAYLILNYISNIASLLYK